MTGPEILQIFRETGALLEDHFVLRSGLHSRQYFQCALALQQMPVVEKLGAELVEKVRPLGAVTVVSPAMGGLVLGQEVAAAGIAGTWLGSPWRWIGRRALSISGCPCSVY